MIKEYQSLQNSVIRAQASKDPTKWAPLHLTQMRCRCGIVLTSSAGWLGSLSSDFPVNAAAIIGGMKDGIYLLPGFLPPAPEQARCLESALHL